MSHIESNVCWDFSVESVALLSQKDLSYAFEKNNFPMEIFTFFHIFEVFHFSNIMVKLK